VDILSATVTLFFIMDPLGNIPLFMSVLKRVPVERRRRVLVREILFAYIVLLSGILLGGTLLRLLALEEESLAMAGGIVLFIVALRMIFPGEPVAGSDDTGEEPFLVPLAIPLFAGPSALAAVLLLQRTAPGQTVPLLVAVTVAWGLSGAILLSSTFFYRVLRERGLMAIERLMGMLLIGIAVQMFMNGLKAFMAR
jgi:multiple antibiotic resistance protein